MDQATATDFRFSKAEDNVLGKGGGMKLVV